MSPQVDKDKYNPYLYSVLLPIQLYCWLLK